MVRITRKRSIRRRVRASCRCRFKGGATKPPQLIPQFNLLTPDAIILQQKARSPAIIVPYREQPAQNRGAQLQQFIQYYTQYFSNQIVKPHIYIIEQSNDGKKFNRGALLNAGARIARKENHDVVILHDVDLIAEPIMMEYYMSFPVHPIHIGWAWKDKYNYDRFLGGILSIGIEDYWKIGGFGNNMYGWGSEDDLLRNRIVRARLTVDRPSIRDTIHEIYHIPTNEIKTLVNMRRWEDLAADDSTRDNVDSLKLNIINTETLSPIVTKYTIALESAEKLYLNLYTADDAINYIKEISEQEPSIAIINTMNYLFNHLHHKAYLMIIKDGDIADWVTLMGRSGISSHFATSLHDFNKSVKWPFQIDNIKVGPTLPTNELRLMNCIIGKLDDEVKNKPRYTESTNSLYLRMFEAAAKWCKIDGNPIPDGFYVISQTDALMLRNDGMEPWIDLWGGLVSLPPQYKNVDFLPLFNSSSAINYVDIALPTPDDWERLQDIKFGKLPDFYLDWDLKIPTAVFRGSGTGCGWNDVSNPRIHLAKLSLTDEARGNDKYPLLDAGIVNTASKLKIHQTERLGYYDKKSNPPFANFMSKTEQSRYKYIIQCDGNVAAYRLAGDMLMGSTILLVESDSRLWFQYKLKPWIHYVPILSDLSDLFQKIRWCKAHDDVCREMASVSRKFAQTLLTEKIMFSFIRNSLTTQFHQAPKVPSKITPTVASNSASKVTPTVVSKVTPTVASKVTPTVASNSVSEDASDQIISLLQNKFDMSKVPIYKVIVKLNA